MERLLRLQSIHEYSNLSRVLYVFDQTGGGLPEDVNGDGVVDNRDLSIVLTNFARGY